VADELAGIPELQGGFDGLGFSQGWFLGEKNMRLAST
jgi:hypothetical protein